MAKTIEQPRNPFLKASESPVVGGANNPVGATAQLPSFPSLDRNSKLKSAHDRSMSDSTIM